MCDLHNPNVFCFLPVKEQLHFKSFFNMIKLYLEVVEEILCPAIQFKMTNICFLTDSVYFNKEEEVDVY